MISKAAISQIRLLHHKKHRDEQGVFIVEGVKSCMEVLSSNWEVRECYVTERFDFKHRAHREHKGCTEVSEKEMERISCLSTAPEILCIVKKPHYQLSNLDDTKPLLVLDAIRDPGNLGTIIRTADWFGFDQILCSEDCVEFTNPKVIQATMGSFTRVKIVYANLSEYLKTQPLRMIYGLYMNGESIQKQLFKHNDIVIIGSESHGISEELVPYINKKIEIPMFPHEGAMPESLNAAIVAGVFMYRYRNE
ncbi:MAG: RNA methyltransferase [Lentimicrobiaceae bacterium]|nr:RNA methyltransferase [Lentimicrobiaceae bacterium]